MIPFSWWEYATIWIEEGLKVNEYGTPFYIECLDAKFKEVKQEICPVFS